MPKYTIPVEKLPPPNKNGDHIFRVRVVSKDGNSTSEYSPLFVIKSLGQIYPVSSIPVITSSSALITIVWETPSIYNTGSAAVGASVQHNHGSEWKMHECDVFIKYHGGSSPQSFTYLGRTGDNQFLINLLNTPRPAGSASATIIGEIASYDEYGVSNRQPNNIFKIFSQTIRF